MDGLPAGAIRETPSGGRSVVGGRPFGESSAGGWPFGESSVGGWLVVEAVADGRPSGRRHPGDAFRGSVGRRR
ncbi:hypothetical protein, partial [Streptomyces acidiscabies]|uniref:hypothetical protein n=1 Tax=Streptomyces acidiscabies TaxID=42234 RepID=UPI001C4C0BCA